MHWVIRVFFLVDNYNVKTNLICNESLFHQTNIVKTQMHCLYVRTGEFQTLWIFLHQANRTLNQLIMFVIYKNSKWAWSGNTTITNRRQPCGIERKSRSTFTRHQEDKLSKATSSLFSIKMIAIQERTQSNVQQNI